MQGWEFRIYGETHGDLQTLSAINPKLPSTLNLALGVWRLWLRVAGASGEGRLGRGLRPITIEEGYLLQHMPKPKARYTQAVLCQR